MGGPNIHPHWREMCYWEIGFGFVEYVDMEDMTEEVERWLWRENPFGGPLGEDLYIDILFEEAVSFMNTEFVLPETIPSVKDCVKTGKWMEGKSGTGGNVSLTIDGKRKLSRKKKPVEGVLHTDYDIEKELVTSGKEQMIVLQKSEPGKIRSVVKTGNHVNRKINYLSSVLEDGLHGSKLIYNIVFYPNLEWNLICDW